LRIALFFSRTYHPAAATQTRRDYYASGSAHQLRLTPCVRPPELPNRPMLLRAALSCSNLTHSNYNLGRTLAARRRSRMGRSRTRGRNLAARIRIGNDARGRSDACEHRLFRALLVRMVGLVQRQLLNAPVLQFADVE
jgi:hypothetical protein